MNEKHILYSKQHKKGVRDWLKNRYGEAEMGKIWEQTQKNYIVDIFAVSGTPGPAPYQ